MNKFSIAAVVAIAAAQEVLPEFSDESPRRHLAANLADIDTQVDCEALVSKSTRWYSYVWNTDACRCEHTWTSRFKYDTPSGQVRNPFYEASTGIDIFIDQSDFDALPATCPEPPEPTCEEIIGDEFGFASAFLQTSGADIPNNTTGYETGVLQFQEMCEGTCGNLTDPCSGTCVTGKFVGLHVQDNILDDSDDRRHFQALAIHEFAIAKASLPKGCEAGGGIWNPDGYLEADYVFIPNDDSDADPDAVYWAGQLKNVKNNLETDQDACLPSTYAYCVEPGRIALSGEDSIIGRSVIIKKNPDDDQQGPLESHMIACGTIGTAIYDMDNIELLPDDSGC